MATTVREILFAEFEDLRLNEGINEDPPRAVINLCQQLGLIRADDNGPMCSKCKINRMQLGVYRRSPDNYAWCCTGEYKNSSKKRVKCNSSRLSIRHQTIFYDRDSSLSTMLMFFNLWCGKVPSKTIAVQCRISEATAVEWSKMMRNILLDCFIFNAPVIGGPGRTVEIDESKFGKRKFHRGRRVDGTWVFGGVERESGRAFMVPVLKRSSDYLVPILRHFVAPGTTIISDCWRAYDCLDRQGFEHLKVNHSLNFVDPETGAHTNTIEGLWRHAKETIGTKSRRRHYMDGYLAKYLFFKWSRKSNLNAFEEFCKFSAVYYAQSQDELLPRAAEWFRLKEEIDQMVVEQELESELDAESEAEYESDEDAAQQDNSADEDWLPE